MTQATTPVAPVATVAPKLTLTSAGTEDKRKLINLTNTEGWDRTAKRSGKEEAKQRVKGGIQFNMLDDLGVLESFNKATKWLRGQPLTKEQMTESLKARISEYKERIKEAQKELDNVDQIVVPPEVIKLSNSIEEFRSIFLNAQYGFPNDTERKHAEKLAKEIAEMAVAVIKDEEEEEEETDEDEEEAVTETASK